MVLEWGVVAKWLKGAAARPGQGGAGIVLALFWRHLAPLPNQEYNWESENF